MNRNRAGLAVLIVVVLGVVCLGAVGFVSYMALVQNGAWAGADSPLQALLPGGTPRATPIKPAALNGPAPDFTLEDLNRGTLQLETLRGKVVVLNFWATWCGPCVAEMGNIQKVYQQHRDDNIVFVSINQGEKREDVQGFMDLYKLTFPVVLDSTQAVGDLYRVQALPTTMFVDEKGIIREIHVGGPMSVDFLEGQVKNLLGQ